MPIVINDFNITINLYTIRPTVVKSVEIETIQQKKIRFFNANQNSNNNNINSQGAIIDEWEELEALSSSTLNVVFQYKYKKNFMYIIFMLFYIKY